MFVDFLFMVDEGDDIFSAAAEAPEPNFIELTTLV